jgi:hypothetical protein
MKDGMSDSICIKNLRIDGYANGTGWSNKFSDALDEAFLYSHLLVHISSFLGWIGYRPMDR